MSSDLLNTQLISLKPDETTTKSSLEVMTALLEQNNLLKQEINLLSNKINYLSEIIIELNNKFSIKSFGLSNLDLIEGKENLTKNNNIKEDNIEKNNNENIINQNTLNNILNNLLTHINNQKTKIKKTLLIIDKNYNLLSSQNTTKRKCIKFVLSNDMINYFNILKCQSLILNKQLSSFISGIEKKEGQLKINNIDYNNNQFYIDNIKNNKQYLLDMYKDFENIYEFMKNNNKNINSTSYNTLIEIFKIFLNKYNK